MRASWNCCWRRVGDDGDNESPSPEPKTSSRSDLRMKNKRWWGLRIVKRVGDFLWIFFGIYEIYRRRNHRKAVAKGPTRRPGACRGPRHQVAWCPGGPHLVHLWSTGLLIFPKKILKNLRSIWSTFIHAQKLHHDNFAENAVSLG